MSARQDFAQMIGKAIFQKVARPSGIIAGHPMFGKLSVSVSHLSHCVRFCVDVRRGRRVYI